MTLPRTRKDRELLNKAKEVYSILKSIAVTEADPSYQMMDLLIHVSTLEDCVRQERYFKAVRHLFSSHWNSKLN